MMTRRHLLRTLPLAAAALVGCNPPPAPPRYKLPRKPLQVITTTVQAADLIREVGKEAVNVQSLIPAGSNPHLWQPTASDLATIRIADAFFLNGLGLEGKFTENLDAMRSQGLHVGVLANGLSDSDILIRPDGSKDPHFWMDLRLWKKAAAEAALVLSDCSPQASAWFDDLGHAYGTDLEQENSLLVKRFSAVPARARFLLTSHDSMAYFGRAYGMEVRSIANAEGEASKKALPELISWRELHRVKILFRESITDIKIIKDLARTLKVIPDLEIFSLSLGKPGMRLPGLISDLEVDRLLPAHVYTSQSILSRLAGE